MSTVYNPTSLPQEGEEKLEEKTVERSVIQMVIILSSDELDKDAIGYQAPLEDSEVDVNGSLDAFDDKKKQQKARTALPTNVRGRGAGAYLGRRGGRGGAAVSTELSGRGGKQGKGTKGSSKAANWNTSSNYRGGKGGSSYNRRENYYSQQPDYYNGAAAYYSSYPPLPGWVLFVRRLPLGVPSPAQTTAARSTTAAPAVHTVIAATTAGTVPPATPQDTAAGARATGVVVAAVRPGTPRTTGTTTTGTTVTRQCRCMAKQP